MAYHFNQMAYISSGWTVDAVFVLDNEHRKLYTCSLYCINTMLHIWHTFSVSVEFLKFVSRFEFATNASDVFIITGCVCIAVGVLFPFLFGMTLMFGYFLRVCFMAPKANVVAAIPGGYRINIHIYSLYSFLLKNKLVRIIVLPYGFATSICGHYTKSHRLGGV